MPGTEALLLILLGLVGGIVSGLLGIGGAVLVIPLLLYVPPLVGIPALPINEITGITLAQVFAASLAGVTAHRRAGNVDAKLVLRMGAPIVVGSFLGAVLSDWLSAGVIKAIYAAVAMLAAALLIRPKPAAPKDAADPDFHPGLAALIAFAVGILAGMVGVGGAFILLPIMVSWMQVPMRLAVGSSLGIVVLSSISGLFGKIITHQVPWLPASFVVLGAIAGGRLGAHFSHRLHIDKLRWALAAMIAFIAVRIVWDLFS